MPRKSAAAKQPDTQRSTVNKELEAIRDAMDKTSGGGRDREYAVELSEAYIKAHPEQFSSFAGLGIEDCVKAVDVFRAAGMNEEQWKVEAYLLAKFEPQNIGGGYEATVRLFDV